MNDQVIHEAIIHAAQKSSQSNQPSNPLLVSWLILLAPVVEPQ